MLLTGLTELTIDAKGRLAIPAKYRNAWEPTRDGAAWVCIPWFAGSQGGLLRLYTEVAFERMASLMGESLLPNEDEAELDAVLFGAAERLEMDSAGRVMLPKHHRSLVELPSEVAVVGARTRLEVRSRETWTQGASERLKALPELVKRIENAKRASQ